MATQVTVTAQSETQYNVTINTGSEAQAEYWANQSAISAADALQSEQNAAISESNALTSANNAATSEDNAADSASDAEKHAQETAPFTDSDGVGFDKGAKGYSEDAKTYSEQFQINECNVYTDENLTIFGFNRPNGTFSTSTSYIRSELLEITGVTRLQLTTYVGVTSVSPVVFYDINENYISGITAQSNETEEFTFEVDVPDNAVYMIVSMKRSEQDLFSLCWDIIVSESKSVKPDIVYISNDGNDSNRGSFEEPFETLQKAKKSVSEKGVIYVKSGDYDYIDIPDLGSVELIGLGEVRFIYGNNRVDSATLEPGFTNVYKSDSPVSLDSNVNYLWQHDIEDDSTLISPSERLPIYNGAKNRLSSTRLTEATSLNDIENSSVLKFIEISGHLYFSKKTGSDLSTNPIIEPTRFSDNITFADITIKNIQFLYQPIYIVGEALLQMKFINVKVLFTLTTAMRVEGVKGSLFELIKCEFAGSENDGIGIHGEAEVREQEVWAHDNLDEGSSAHINSYVKRFNSVYENNGSDGIFDVNSSKSYNANILVRNNNGGISYSNTSGVGDGEGNSMLTNSIIKGDITVNEANRFFVYNSVVIDGNVDLDVNQFNLTSEST